MQTKFSYISKTLIHSIVNPSKSVNQRNLKNNHSVPKGTPKFYVLYDSVKIKKHKFHTFFSHPILYMVYL